MAIDQTSPELDISFTLDQNKLKRQVESEYLISFSTVNRKRQIFREQDQLFDGIEDNTKNKSKIDLKTLFYNVQAWMATYYTDRKTVKFQSRRYGMQDQAERLEKLAEFDKDEMNLDTLNYECELNRVLRGVGIRARIGWDKNRKVPVWKVMDTRNWVPDPNGWYDPKGFRWHGFDLTSTFAELNAADGFFNLQQLKNIIDSIQKEGSQAKTTRSYAQRSSALNPAEQGNTDDPLLHLYYHYTTYYDDDNKPHKLLTCWGADRNVLIKVEEIKAVYKEEEENPNLISFPVVLKYFVPKPFDPFGVSLTDLVQDKHRFKNVLANLMFIREKNAALGDDLLYDTNVVKNPNDLTTPSLSQKFIGADGRQGPIQSAIAVIPKNPSSPANYNFMDLLDRSTSFATGFDARQMGIQGTGDITLGEAQQIQANANLKTQYFNIIGATGEKQFWKEWLRAYHENFKSSETKIVRITDSFGTKNLEFKKNDFLSEEDPDVKIISSADAEAENKQKQASLGPILLQIMADPNKPALAKNQALRKWLKMNGMEDDEVYEYAPMTYEELDALQLLELINAGNPLGAKIDEQTAADVDHNTYIMIFKQAIDNEVKQQAIEARKQMIVALKQNLQTTSQNADQMNNMAASSMMASANSANTPNVISRINPNQ